MDFDEHADPPLYCTVKETSIFSSDQFPEFSDVIRMCKVCNLKGKKLCNIYIYIRCTAPQCNAYLHFTTAKNCFKE